MDSVILQDELLESLEKNTPDRDRDLSALVNEAIAEYVLRLERAKIKRELEAYTSMHGNLKESYLGKWVAVHQGEIVDCDDEASGLHRRIRAKYGPTAVLITQVREQPIQEIRIRSPRLVDR